jgi:hypothetical protein
MQCRISEVLEQSLRRVREFSRHFLRSIRPHTQIVGIVAMEALSSARGEKLALHQGFANTGSGTHNGIHLLAPSLRGRIVLMDCKRRTDAK